METSLSFKDVCRFIKEDDPKLIENVDLMLGLVLILSPMILVPSPATVAPALGLLTVKNELTKIGKVLFQKLTGKKDKDSLAKQQRMEIAYCLICYTAYFEALDTLVPEVNEYIGMEPSERITLARSAITELQNKCSEACPTTEISDAALDSTQIQLPHPVDGFDQQSKQLLPLYEEMTKGLQKFIQGLPL